MSTSGNTLQKPKRAIRNNNEQEHVEQLKSVSRKIRTSEEDEQQKPQRATKSR